MYLIKTIRLGFYDNCKTVRITERKRASIANLTIESLTEYDNNNTITKNGEENHDLVFSNFIRRAPSLVLFYSVGRRILHKIPAPMGQSLVFH